MYKKFYNLKENPFKLSPDLRYFFLHKKAKSILNLLNYAINQNVGFIMLTGEVGVGKTSLLRYFLNQLGNSVERAYLFNPTFSSSSELLSFLAMDLGILSEGTFNLSKVILLDKIYKFLLKKYEEKKKVLFIIDDAQALPDFLLEELRLLSNFETNKDKLIQILLIGQPELKNKIEKKSMRQLNQRVAVKIQMNPLTKEETAEYINYRLFIAGSNNSIFTRKAIKVIYKKSKGLPRLINLIAERALIAGYLKNKEKIDKKEVKIAISDLRL